MNNNINIQNQNNLHNGCYVKAPALYLQLFGELANTLYINCIDGEKACKQFMEVHKHLIVNTYCHSWYCFKKKKYIFDNTILVLNNNCIIDFEEDSINILHYGHYNVQQFLKNVTSICAKNKERKRKQPLEINLIVNSIAGLELKSMEIKATKLDINLFYENDFAEIDQTIRTRLNKKEDKGVVLLHGLPGTGKTTYLRYLIGKIKKRILFISPSVASNLMNPDLIQLLIDNPNTVLVIEDAENIIMDRKYGSNGGVSNLLNISDGLLADFLNVQIICTFNSALSMVDEALLRKGRLIARYEFGKLSVPKANALATHLKLNANITEPQTLAAITNPSCTNFDLPKRNTIGFKQYEEALN
jgi:ATPase family associated with various cellular activities (AAA)